MKSTIFIFSTLTHKKKITSLHLCCCHMYWLNVSYPEWISSLIDLVKLQNVLPVFELLSHVGRSFLTARTTTNLSAASHQGKEDSRQVFDRVKCRLGRKKYAKIYKSHVFNKDFALVELDDSKPQCYFSFSGWFHAVSYKNTTCCCTFFFFSKNFLPSLGFPKCFLVHAALSVIKYF